MSEWQPEYQKRLAKARKRKIMPFPFGLGIFKTIKIALRNLFRPHIVIQYPKVKYELPPRARYTVRMKYDDQGNHKCRACMICQNTCPDFIIDIDVTVGEDRSKFINRFEYQQGACMICGLCVEACPYDAIRMSHDYELAHRDMAGLTIDLLENVPAVPMSAPRQRGADA